MRSKLKLIVLNRPNKEQKYKLLKEITDFIQNKYYS